MDVAHIGCWLQDEACEVNVLRVVRFLRVWQKLLMWLDGCKIGLTVESEEGEVPHLRWSQAPPLPWRRPGSADLFHLNIIPHWLFLDWFGLSRPSSKTPREATNFSGRDEYTIWVNEITTSLRANPGNHG